MDERVWDAADESCAWVLFNIEWWKVVVSVSVSRGGQEAGSSAGDAVSAQVDAPVVDSSPMSGGRDVTSGVYVLRDWKGTVLGSGCFKDLPTRERAYQRTPATSWLKLDVKYFTNDADTRRGLAQVVYDMYPSARAETASE